MKRKLNIFMLLRWVLAGIFMISGAHKLLGPLENVMFAIQDYQIVYRLDSIELMAVLFPWIEFLTGVFLLIGLWTKLALINSGGMGAAFIISLGQAITRDIPLRHCGCFGDLVNWPMWTTFIFYWVIVALLVLLYLNINQANQISFDQKLSEEV